MSVRKVKYLSERMTVERVEANGRHTETLLLEGCPDPPKESFLDALEAVRKDALARLGLGAQFTKATKISGVTVSRDGQGHRQFKLSATVETKTGVSGFSLPLMREKVESEEGVTVLSAIELKRIEKLLGEAENYALGARIQGELDLDGTDG